MRFTTDGRDLPLPERRAHPSQAPRLAGRQRDCEAFILEGGIDAWKKAGLPVATDRSQPLEFSARFRSAPAASRSSASLLGLLVSPWFFAVPAVVGAGLVTAG